MKAVLFYHKSDHNQSILISHPLCLNPMVDIKALLEISCDTRYEGLVRNIMWYKSFNTKYNLVFFVDAKNWICEKRADNIPHVGQKNFSNKAALFKIRT